MNWLRRLLHLCPHAKWTTKTTFNLPVGKKFECEGMSEDTMLRMFYGFTIIEQHCAQCGKVNVRTVTGKT